MQGLTSPITRTPPWRVAVAIAALGSASCETSQYVGRRLTPENANVIRQAAGRSALEVTAPGIHGVRTVGRISRVLETEVLVDLPDPAGEVRVASGDISEVRVRSHVLGALEGTAIGFLSSAAGGAVLFLAACSSSKNGCFEAEPAGAALLGGIGFGVIGGLVGLVVGGVRGHVTTFSFY
jgi:hypothetical protein